MPLVNALQRLRSSCWRGGLLIYVRWAYAWLFVKCGDLIIDEPKDDIFLELIDVVTLTKKRSQNSCEDSTPDGLTESGFG